MDPSPSRLYLDQPPRMRYPEQLLGGLAKLVDLQLNRRALGRVRNRFDVDGALVRQVVKD